MNAAVRKSITRFAVTASVMAITSIVFFAPAATAVPMKLCDFEMGPNGLQCVQETKQVELCKLDENLKCVQPPKQVELCDLEMGPDGLQCVEEKVDDFKTPDEPKPPVDPEPEPQPEPDAGQAPEEVKPQTDPDLPVEQAGVPEFEIAASPALDQPRAPSYAGWIGSALVAFGLLVMFARRRAQAKQDAAAALESM